MKIQLKVWREKEGAGGKLVRDKWAVGGMDERIEMKGMMGRDEYKKIR